MTERGARRGELRPGLDPQLVLELLIGPLHARAFTAPDTLTADIPAQIVDNLMRGIGTPGQLASRPPRVPGAEGSACGGAWHIRPGRLNARPGCNPDTAVGVHRRPTRAAASAGRGPALAPTWGGPGNAPLPRPGR
ncbi:TetR-like C-terminal domain-containing protein [Streptomyces sp. NPDC054796]